VRVGRAVHGAAGIHRLVPVRDQNDLVGNVGTTIAKDGVRLVDGLCNVGGAGETTHVQRLAQVAGVVREVLKNADIRRELEDGYMRVVRMQIVVLNHVLHKINGLRVVHVRDARGSVD